MEGSWDFIGPSQEARAAQCSLSRRDRGGMARHARELNGRQALRHPRAQWPFSKQREHLKGSLQSAARCPGTRHLQHLPKSQAGMGRGGNARVGEAGQHRPRRGSTSCHPSLASVSCITQGSVGGATETELVAAGGVNGANSSSSSSTSSSARGAQDTGRPMSKATVAISEGHGAHWSRGESSSRWRRALSGTSRRRVLPETTVEGRRL